MKLRWEEQQDGNLFGYCGGIMIGMVVKRSTDGAVVWSAHEGVHMKWTAKTNGEAKDFAAAKRAVERSWTIWLDRAGLVGKSPANVGK